MSNDERDLLKIKTIQFMENVSERSYSYRCEIHCGDLDLLNLCFNINDLGSFNLRVQAINYPRDEISVVYRVQGEFEVNPKLNENFGLCRAVNYDLFDLKNHLNNVD